LGGQWNHLPPEFGSDSTVHRTVCRWGSKGVLDRLWAVLIYHCEELQAVHWKWQAADDCLSEARFDGRSGGKADRARHRKIAQKIAQGQTTANRKQTRPEAETAAKASGAKVSGAKVSGAKVSGAKASARTPPAVASWA